MNVRHMMRFGGPAVREGAGFVYIGPERAFGLSFLTGTKWSRDRDSHCRGHADLIEYAERVWANDALRRALHELEGKDLLCICASLGGISRDEVNASLRCHGQVFWILLDRMNALVERGGDYHLTTLRPFASGVESSAEYWRRLREGSEWPKHWPRLP